MVVHDCNSQSALSMPFCPRLTQELCLGALQIARAPGAWLCRLAGSGSGLADERPLKIAHVTIVDCLAIARALLVMNRAHLTILAGVILPMARAVSIVHSQ